MGWRLELVPRTIWAGQTYRDRVVLEASAESLHHVGLVLFLYYAGGGRKNSVGRLTPARVGSHAEVEEDAQDLRPRVICGKIRKVSLPWRRCGLVEGKALTVVCVLSCHISNGIADLVAHDAFGLVGQALEKLLPDSTGMVGAQGDKDFSRLAAVVLARLRGYAAEDDGGKGSQLQGHTRAGVSGASRTVRRGREPRRGGGRRTEASAEPEICSARPINKTSGRGAVQLICRWSSACERVPLSGDWRASKSWLSSAWISAGSIDILATGGGAHDGNVVP